MIVFDDYAENIQQNQVKTAILAAISRLFFEENPRLRPVFQGKTRSTRGVNQVASFRQLAVGGVPRNPIKNRPSPRSSRQLKPAPA